MNFQKYKDFPAPIIRISLALVMLWFGVTWLVSPQNLIGYLPAYASSLPISLDTLGLLTGIFEVIIGLLLLIGLFTRTSALITFIHIFIISIGLGYNDVAIRDYALSLVALAVFLNGFDKFTIDNKRYLKKFSPPEESNS